MSKQAASEPAESEASGDIECIALQMIEKHKARQAEMVQAIFDAIEKWKTKVFENLFDFQKNWRDLERYTGPTLDFNDPKSKCNNYLYLKAHGNVHSIELHMDLHDDALIAQKRVNLSAVDDIKKFGQNAISAIVENLELYGYRIDSASAYGTKWYATEGHSKIKVILLKDMPDDDDDLR